MHTSLHQTNSLKASYGSWYDPVGEEFSGLPWVWGFPWGFPWVWVWDGYGDVVESPWVCGDSVGMFEWIPNYMETS